MYIFMLCSLNFAQILASLMVSSRGAEVSQNVIINHGNKAQSVNAIIQIRNLRES